MRALLCKKYGPPEFLEVEDVASPKPGKGQLLIQVQACGVNFPDTLIIEGKYQFKPEPPFSPGAEVAGIVKEVGEGVSGFKPGDAVVSGTTWGGYAEEVLAPASNTFAVPGGMDPVTAAASFMTYGTSYHALHDRAQMQAGETLLVLGAAGGVGLAAIQIGKAMGARVIAAASSDEKLSFCKANGADEVLNYSHENLKNRLKEVTGGHGVDVILDPVGGNLSEQAFRGIAWKGRHLVVGFTSGEIPALPLNLPLLKGGSVVGVFWGSFFRKEPLKNAENVQVMSGWFQEGKLKPRIHRTFPLEQGAEALLAMKRREVLGKMVIVI